jgi:hypothetical protein
MNARSPAKAKSLAVRKSMSRSQLDPDSKAQRTPLEYDMAEQLNEEIGNKYVKGLF